MATRRIKFIGSTNYKKDNVCRSNLYWAFPGAIVEAPEDIAVRLLAHPDVWTEADDDDKGLPMKDDPTLILDQNLTRDERIEIIIGIIKSEDCLFEVMSTLDPDFEDSENTLTDGEFSGNSGLAVNHQANYERLLKMEENMVKTGVTVALDPETINTDAGLGDAESGVDDTGKGPAKPLIAFSVNREEAIVQAIEALDRDNEDHFTKDEIPRVEAVSKLLNYEITAQERTTAWETIQEGEGN